MLLGRYPPDFSGHGTQTWRTLPHLERLGVEPTVVTRETAPGVQWPFDGADAVQRILPVGRDPLSRARSAVALHAHLRRQHGRYDVLHSALPDWEFFLNLPYLGRVGLPVLFEMILLGSDDPVSLRSGRLGALKNRLLGHVDLWVGIANAFRSPVREAGIPEERFRRIYTGVDLERYRPASGERRRALRERFGIPAEARVVVSVGGLMPRKGMDRLLRAWARLEPRPGRELLVVVGPASEAEGLRPWHLEHARALQVQAGQPGLAGTVRLAGRSDAVEDHLAAADVFAFLSRREGFGTVTAEAMCCGLPCVISPLDGIGHELIDHGATGYVVEDCDDADQVAARLRELLADPGRRTAMGAAALESARARFSMETRARELADAYRMLAAGKRTRPITGSPSGPPRR